MSDIHTIEPQPIPKHKMAFLMDWLITLKCNYDCGYCGPGVNGFQPGHDNSIPHPDADVCEKMLSQGFEYVDAYMEKKRPNMRALNLNIYGGEALYRGDIEYLMDRSSELYAKYKDRWSLQRILTTNASSDLEKWKNVTDHVEYVQFSFHTDGPPKLQDNFFRNIEYHHSTKKPYSAIVLMYPKKWERSMYALEYMQRKGYNVRPRILDGHAGVYTNEQLQQIFDAMKEKDHSLLEKINNDKTIDQSGRACCGGRPMCINRNLKEPKKFVPRDSWQGWKCSANQFFLFMDCVSRKFHTTKDCWVRPDGTVGALATIETMDKFIAETKAKLQETPDVFLTCAQKICRCGTCAPKSTTSEGLSKVLNSYNI
jgi:hypothetical protein